MTSPKLNLCSSELALYNTATAGGVAQLTGNTTAAVQYITDKATANRRLNPVALDIWTSLKFAGLSIGNCISSLGTDTPNLLFDWTQH